MQHCAPDSLALAALGEPLPADEAEHLAGCESCGAEVTSLRHAVVAARSPGCAPSADSPPVPVPDRVWAAIAAETGVRSTPAGVGLPAPVPAEAGAGVPAQQASGAPSGVVGLAEHRQRRERSAEGRRGHGPLVGAVAASLVVGAGLGAAGVVLATGGDDEPPAQDAVASAVLDPLGSGTAAGSAAVHSADGASSLQVDVQLPTASGGYYEVWLLDREAQRMVPVGVVRDGTTVLDLPDGLDLGEFPVVDVSFEPLDGDPTHSGDSLVRGVLES